MMVEIERGQYLERLLVLKDIAQVIHSTNTGQLFLKLLISKFVLTKGFCFMIKLCPYGAAVRPDIYECAEVCL